VLYVCPLTWERYERYQKDQPGEEMGARRVRESQKLEADVLVK